MSAAARSLATSSPARRAAYFDVDGTLTLRPTIFEFLRYDARRSGRLAEAEDLLGELEVLRAAGEGREVRLQRYYSWWAGRSVSQVDRRAISWFAEELARPAPDMLRADVVQRLRRHQSGGQIVVLVSGSFLPAILPLAQHLHVHEVIASQLVVVEGTYTGAVEDPMIGTAKRTAVFNHARRSGIDLAQSWAYGDDDSDLPFMALTGHPTLVGAPGAPGAPGEAGEAGEAGAGG